MLANMQAYVQSHADVIHQVTGINVEIMDTNMVRIAGTGIYASQVASSLDNAGEIYKEVLRSHQTILVESPRHHSICANCHDRANCKERFSLATPIVDGDVVYGVIGLVCFTDEDRRKVMDSLESYTAFIKFLADALAAKILEEDKFSRATRFLDLMLKAVDVPGQGIMLFAHDGTLTYSNRPAREFCGLGDDSGLDFEHVQRTGHAISSFEEFDISLPGGVHTTVLGRTQDLGNDKMGKATLFVFELPMRLASLVGDLSSGAAATGFENIVGNSPALRKLKVKALKVADSSSTVLINGDSGTGKELLARAIHQASPRRDAPFIAINCGAMPDALLESELFGYVSGAFTGASSKGRMGKFELANGGVIFLDEISAMPLYMQVKLLRVLQERVIIRLGSNKLMHVDVRVIAATNEDLQECIRRNSFREDLFYRLNVIPLTMPPLREREGDVAILADYFLNKYCSLFGKPKPRISSALLELLESYPWPGNVRELEHVIEYAVNMMPESGLLTLDCLPSHLLGASREHAVQHAAPASAAAGLVQAPDEVIPLPVLEEKAIRNALEKFGNTTNGKKQAAKALGLSLATLYRKMQSFSI